jgi:hypothetical protein
MKSWSVKRERGWSDRKSWVFGPMEGRSESRRMKKGRGDGDGGEAGWEWGQHA